MRKIIFDTFKIIDRRKDNIITLEGQTNQKKYIVKVIPEHIEKLYS
jgi:hypothetical protein